MIEVRGRQRHGALGSPQGSDIILENSPVAAKGTCMRSPQSRGIPVGGRTTPKGESHISFRLELKHEAEGRSPDKVGYSQYKNVC